MYYFALTVKLAVTQLIKLSKLNTIHTCTARFPVLADCPQVSTKKLGKQTQYKLLHLTYDSGQILPLSRAVSAYNEAAVLHELLPRCQQLPSARQSSLSVH